MQDASERLDVGAAGSARETAGEETLASRYGSGTLEVYSTPAMIALMEAASMDAVGQSLPEGWTTVGISLDVRHVDATPPGMEVVAEAELRAIEGLRLIFDVRARDEVSPIGAGTHQRYCVEIDPFLDRCDEKARGAGADAREGR